MVRRTGQPSQKQSVGTTLKTLFEYHTHVDALKADLRRAGFVHTFSVISITR